MKYLLLVFSAPLPWTMLLWWVAFTMIPSSVQSGPLTNCQIDCGPRGHCFDGECECDSGFAGADCSFPFEICPDLVMQCYGTGAVCVKDRTGYYHGDSHTTPHYACRCDNHVSSESPFQIQQCENPVSQHCEQGKVLSEYAFCTNGGTCLAFVRQGERHVGCQCPPGFEGRHCQYLEGTAPSYELQNITTTSSSSSSNTSTGALDGFIKFLIAVVCLAVIAGMSCIIYTNYQAKQATAAKVLTLATTEEEEDFGEAEMEDLDCRAGTTMNVASGGNVETNDVETNEESRDVGKGEMA